MLTPRALGIALLLVAAASVIVLPPGWPTIGLAVLAWVALARDERLGGLLAAALVILALPYDRAADVGVMRLAGIPIRPHDAVVGLGLLTGLPALRRVRATPAVLLLALFGTVGLAALVLGLLNDQAARDILRDARWWGLYAGGLLLAGMHRPPQDVLRAILIGLTVFALLAVAATVLPAFEGGIKARAMGYDFGVLRMQFGPTAFLLIPIAYWAYRLGRGTRWLPAAGGLVLFLMALALAVTRVGLIVGPLVALGAVVLGVAHSGWSRRSAGRLIGAMALAVGGLGLALGLNTVGVGGGSTAQITPSPTPSVAPAPASVPAGTAPAPSVPAVSPTPPPAATESPVPTETPRPTPVLPTVEPRNPLVRLIPGLEFLATTGTRLEAYLNAGALVAQSPLIGHGLGSLVDIPYGFGGTEFDTPGKLPSVDNAYLTIGMKAGLVGILAYLALVMWPVWRLGRVTSWRAAGFLLPAWLGMLALTLTQSYAVIGYSPFVLGLLIVAIDRFPSRPGAGQMGQHTPDEGQAGRAAELPPS
jgi:hypothetical protein